ncbi:MAG: hypothetical protein GY941_17825 [Planctomycetes bacterium]|nr:hypothetical protein [Planctomycetota bacterium]
MSSGWVKLHRKILDNDIFKNDKLFRVFMYLLLKASHSERDQLIGDSIVSLKAGQWATGRKAISRDTGLTEQNVRTAISKLEKLGILTIKVTVKYSIFSISNWDCYQQDNQQVTNNQPASNQQVTTINNVKNEKNVKEVIAHLNLVVNAKYKHTTKSHYQNISARLDDGYSVDDLKLVINSKANEWLNDKTMAQYLRPSTLFQASKFQGYLTSAKPVLITNKPRGFTQ